MNLSLYNLYLKKDDRSRLLGAVLLLIATKLVLISSAAPLFSIHFCTFFGPTGVFNGTPVNCLRAANANIVIIKSLYIVIS